METKTVKTYGKDAAGRVQCGSRVTILQPDGKEVIVHDTIFATGATEAEFLASEAARKSAIAKAHATSQAAAKKAAVK